MAARAIWKGQVVIGEARVPVKLYSAVQDRKVHFRLLGPRAHEPVRQRMVSSRTGREVPPEKAHKAYPTDDGRLVVLGEEELSGLEPEPSRDIVLTRFLEAGRLESAWYERPYWLGPDGDDGAYAALVAALAAEAREGIAHWVMRKKAYAGALRVRGEHALLVTLRRAGEVVPASALPRPGGRAAEPQEIRMAEQLLAALSGDFDLTEYRSEYRERVLELIAAKAEGRAVERAEFRREAVPEEDLAARLRESLAAMKAA